MKPNYKFLCPNNTLVFSIQGYGENNVSIDKNIAGDRGTLRPNHAKCKFIIIPWLIKIREERSLSINGDPSSQIKIRNR
jgi:hypothetical protein